jgi:hypothetical protein
LLMDLYYVFLCIRAPDLNGHGQSICAHHFLKTTYHRREYSATSAYSCIYLVNTNTHTHPNENIQEVGLAHLRIDEVMWYCLYINQACVFNYDLMVSIYIRRTQLRKIDSDKSQSIY